MFSQHLNLADTGVGKKLFPVFSRRAGSGRGSLCGTQQQTQQGSVVLEDRAQKSWVMPRWTLAGEGQK